MKLRGSARKMLGAPTSSDRSLTCHRTLALSLPTNWRLGDFRGPGEKPAPHQPTYSAGSGVVRFQDGGRRQNMLKLRSIRLSDYAVLEGRQRIGRIRLVTEHMRCAWLWSVAIHLPRRAPDGLIQGSQHGQGGVQGGLEKPEGVDRRMRLHCCARQSAAKESLWEANMLISIDPILNADVLYALRAMGHGDDLVLCDTNFPADAVARQTVLARLL